MRWKALGWVVLCLCLTGGAREQSSKVEEPSASTEYYYRFESPMFDIMRAELRFDQTTRGQFIFRRKSDEEDIKLELHILSGTIQRIDRYLTEAQFFTSHEEYQGDRNMSHLGTVTIRVRQGAKERQVSFNYTRLPAMQALAELFQHLVTQETRTFTIQLARQFEPLDLDRQLLALKREVKNGWVAEPARLLPLLEDLQADDGVLLMARRRAGEIAKLIKEH